jgi:hypothetical protein
LAPKEKENPQRTIDWPIVRSSVGKNSVTAGVQKFCVCERNGAFFNRGRDERSSWFWIVLNIQTPHDKKRTVEDRAEGKSKRSLNFCMPDFKKKWQQKKLLLRGPTLLQRSSCNSKCCLNVASRFTTYSQSLEKKCCWYQGNERNKIKGCCADLKLGL